MVIDEKQSENVNEMEEEVAPVNKSSAAMVKQSLNIKSCSFFRIIRNKKQQH
jgi:hypothetical protein